MRGRAEQTEKGKRGEVSLSMRVSGPVLFCKLHCEELAYREAYCSAGQKFCRSRLLPSTSYLPQA